MLIFINIRQIRRTYDKVVTLPSTQFATIAPGMRSCAALASRARSSRLRSLTCGTSRKIGTVVNPRPVLDREATPTPRVLSRPSATSRLGPLGL